MGDASGGIFISAPGKIILFGEHAVVYGRTAVAGSIDLRTYISLFTSQDGRIYLSLPDLGVEKTWMLKDLLKASEKLGEYGAEDGGSPPSLEAVVPVARKLSGSCEEQCGVQHLAILAFWYLLLGIAQRKKDLLAVKVTVRFKLPSCVGLGSSGAYCVCIAASLLQSAGLIPRPNIPTGQDGCYTWSEQNLDMIRKWAASAESIIHGRASGLDAAVCTYGRRVGQYQSFELDAHVCSHGGVACFKPGSRIHHLRNLPELKVMLVNSKVERNTSRMVATVKDRLKKFPQVVEGIFNAIDAISQDAVRTLDRSDHEPKKACTEEEHHTLQAQNAEVYSQLADLCRMNNQLLIALGVGHPKIDQICTSLARYGIHPKMTGAGGGGSVYAFLKPGTADTSQTILDMISKEITGMGYEIWQPPLGGDGVMMHSTKPDILQMPAMAMDCNSDRLSNKLSDGSIPGQ